ncbi:flagellar biosynthetic protein FliQ [bacterium]|nr:flagellar biosynthetic protein FliQ [bacterium]
MEDSIVIQIIQTAMILTIQVSTPVLAVGIIVGLLISIFQSVTQIQESTLTFVPKLFCGIITFIIVLPWTIQIFRTTTNELFDLIPTLINAG